MNRRGVATALILLLLSLLLVWQVTRPSPPVPKKPPVVKPKVSLEDKSVPAEEKVVEPPQPEPVAQPEEPKAIVELINHSGWVGKSGNYEVFGEVKNTGQAVAREVAVRVTFKDAAWQLVGEASAPANRPTLAPGEKSAFKVVLPQRDRAARVGSYVAIVTVRR